RGAVVLLALLDRHQDRDRLADDGERQALLAGDVLGAGVAGELLDLGDANRLVAGATHGLERDVLALRQAAVAMLDADHRAVLVDRAAVVVAQEGAEAPLAAPGALDGPADRVRGDLAALVGLEDHLLVLGQHLEVGLAAAALDPPAEAVLLPRLVHLQGLVAEFDVALVGHHDVMKSNPPAPQPAGRPREPARSPRCQRRPISMRAAISCRPCGGALRAT